MNRPGADSTARASIRAGAARQTGPVVSAAAIATPSAQPGTDVTEPRIIRSLRVYLEEGRRGYFACFACRATSAPARVCLSDTHGRERRCGACGQQCAVPLEQAVREGWLQVIDSEGVVQND